MTHKVHVFIKANQESPVVYGSAVGGERGPEHVQGVFYRLADGRTFELTSAECRTIGHPRWAHVA